MRSSRELKTIRPLPRYCTISLFASVSTHMDNFTSPVITYEASATIDVGQYEVWLGIKIKKVTSMIKLRGDMIAISRSTGDHSGIISAEDGGWEKYRYAAVLPYQTHLSSQG